MHDLPGGPGLIDQRWSGEALAGGTERTASAGEQPDSDRDRSDLAELFRLGFDGALIGMALSHPDTGRYLRVNDALCRLLGRSRGELMAVSIESVTHPEDRADEQENRRAMVNDNGLEFQRQKRYVRPDGEIVWVVLSAAPVRRGDGSVQAVFSQVVDITERKEHEAHFEHDVNDAVWLGRIRAAIEEDRLILYSQPIVDLRTGETVQQELLIRMLGEDGSIIAPGNFLPIAERYGLISEIDRWVIRQAVALAARGEPTEFNLSGASIGDPDILRELGSAIQQTGADPSLLVVEVTETAMMDKLDAGRVFAEQVAELGCELAIDDFGTGYASLSYLKHVPARRLKIDIEFIRDLVRSETDGRLVRGIIGIAREFDQITIAEGIEDQATLIRLREMGVNYGQGYLFGRPQPAAGVPYVAALVAAPAPTEGTDVDPVDLVRTAFAAFAGRDLATLLSLCRADVVVRPHSTAERVGRRAAYRGHEGIRAYADDVGAVWSSLTLTPTAFRLVDQSVIVFGHVDAESATHAQTVDVLWVWELRDGLIASVEVFHTARRDAARKRANGPTRLLPQGPSDSPGGDAQSLRGGHSTEPERRAAARPRGSDTVAADQFVPSYRESLRVGDPHAAAVVIDGALAAGWSAVEIQSRVVAPAMWWIGDLWARRRITVADEHLATAVSHHVLTRLYPSLLSQVQRRGDTIVVAAVDGEHHVLGLRMAADVLEGAGFDVRFLGADVPESSLLAWVSEHRPAAVALGVTMTSSADALSRELQALRDYDPGIGLIIGGQGVPAALRESPAVFYAADTECLAEFVDRDLKVWPAAQLPQSPTRDDASGHPVLHDDTHTATEVAARLAQTTAATADAARGQARRAFALEQIAFRDPLTELWNRRAFDDRYQALTATEVPGPAVLMVDIDDFKTINDRFGHDAGDRALIAVARCITGVIRPNDFAARYGGDEFVVLLPDTAAHVAAHIGERIRNAVTTELTDPATTVSIGVSVPGHADRRRATLDVDHALYEAKQRGRNQVAFANRVTD
jgi:diguanylate cyclase (GGDEF)-like protein/PAS domain S-box-containing protein